MLRGGCLPRELSLLVEGNGIQASGGGCLHDCEASRDTPYGRGPVVMEADPVDCRTRLLAIVPRLRRFAFALLGDLQVADCLVADFLVEFACRTRMSAVDDRTSIRQQEIEFFEIATSTFLGKHEHFARASSASTTQDKACFNSTTACAASLTRYDGIQRAVLELPPRKRAILALVCIESFSYSEAASIMQLPVEELKATLAGARIEVAAAMAPSRGGNRVCIDEATARDDAGDVLRQGASDFGTHFALRLDAAQGK